MLGGMTEGTEVNNGVKVGGFRREGGSSCGKVVNSQVK